MVVAVLAVFCAIFAILVITVVLYVVAAVLWPVHILLKAMGFKGIFASYPEVKTITIRKAGPE